MDFTDRDRRQFSRIAERLDLFRRGDLSLRALIADIEFLIGALTGVDAGVRQRLREPWGALEEVYSVAVVMHDNKLDAHAESLIRDAVTTLSEYIDEILGTTTGGVVH